MAEALNVAFGTAFSDGAGDLWNKRKDQSKARAWARATFGEEHRLTALLTRSEPWIAETIKRRNASEHPGGWCGRLTVLNFRVSPEGQILDPAWFRRDTPPTDLVRDLVGLVDDMLVFGEELVASIAETHAWGPMLEIEEVPEGVRDPQAPVRLRINLKTEFALPPEDKDASGQR